MSARWESYGTGACAVARVCDGCGTQKPMLTLDGLPMAWTRKSPCPPGWSRVETENAVRHYCKACWRARAKEAGGGQVTQFEATQVESDEKVDLDAMADKLSYAATGAIVFPARDLFLLIAHARELRAEVAELQKSRVGAEEEWPAVTAIERITTERDEARARVAELEANIDAADGCKACAFSPPDLRIYAELTAARAVVEAARLQHDCGEPHSFHEEIRSALAAYDAIVGDGREDVPRVAGAFVTLEMLRELEWSGRIMVPEEGGSLRSTENVACCPLPKCSGLKREHPHAGHLRVGHVNGCALAALIREAEGGK